MSEHDYSSGTQNNFIKNSFNRFCDHNEGVGGAGFPAMSAIQHVPPGTQENYNSFSSGNSIIEKAKEIIQPEGPGGGKGEPGVPPTAIESCYFEFHDLANELVNEICGGENMEFGVLRLKTPKVALTKKPTFVFFSVDATDSMHDGASGSSKIDIVKNTFKNIMLYLSKIDAPIYISVHTFNETIKIIVDNMHVTCDNVSQIIEKIGAIQASGCTNIELALQNAKAAIATYAESNPEHQIAHIFMTDGHATTGSTDREELGRIVTTTNCGSVFIGFGNDHNVQTLKRLSDNNKSFYQYIRHFENTASVYAELLYPYLYPCADNVSLLVENCEIYNWKTNTWTTRFDEGILMGDAEKVYHIRRTKHQNVVVDVHGYDFVTGAAISEQAEELPHLLSMETNQQYPPGTQENYNSFSPRNPITEKGKELKYPEGAGGGKGYRGHEVASTLRRFAPLREPGVPPKTNDIIRTDLSQYIYRHKTLELLYRASSVSGGDSRRAIRADIRNVFTKLRDYMRCQNKTADEFLKQLCDDLYLAYNELKNNAHNNMFTLSRFTSQGRQQTNVSTPRADDSHDITPPSTPRPGLSRQNTGSRPMPLEEEHEIDDYQISETQTSCYATQTVLDAMTQIQD